MHIHATCLLVPVHYSKTCAPSSTQTNSKGFLRDSYLTSSARSTLNYVGVAKPIAVLARKSNTAIVSSITKRRNLEECLALCNQSLVFCRHALTAQDVGAVSGVHKHWIMKILRLISLFLDGASFVEVADTFLDAKLTVTANLVKSLVQSSNYITKS